MNQTTLPPFDPLRLDEICTGLNARMLVLFGSRATGTPAPNEESDIDLALLVSDAARHQRSWEYHAALAEVFPECRRTRQGDVAGTSGLTIGQGR